MCCRRCDARIAQTKDAILRLLYATGPVTCVHLPDGLTREQNEYYPEAVSALLNDGRIIKFKHRFHEAYALGDAERMVMVKETILRVLEAPIAGDPKPYIPEKSRGLYDRAIEELINEGKVVRGK